MLRLALAFVFIALPLLELALLIKTGQLIGFWATLAIVVGTGLLGAHVLFRQSWTVVRRTQEALAHGRAPVAPVLDGAFLLLAGTLLITPGLLSDTVALLLLVPPIRHAVARWGVKRLVRNAHVRFGAFNGKIADAPGSAPPNAGQAKGPVIEGEFERLGEKATGPHRGKDRDQV